MSQPAVLAMGFSPAAAVITWRLARSGQFSCYTYWPTNFVHFESEIFGDETFESTPFDLGNPKELALLPTKQFAVVILVVPTIKDVVRMCRKLQPVLTKQTQVLVDVSGGIAPVQRLVKTNLGSAYQVSGMICDFDAEYRVDGSQWAVIHRNAQQVSQNAIILEPSVTLAKTLAPLGSALTSAGLFTSTAKTTSAFGEVQWQRTISVVAFEVLTVALDVPQPENLAGSLIAKPIVEGLVSELAMIAAAIGVKGLPSKSQLVSRGPKLARRAPATFWDNRASRIYYDVYRKASIALDFLVLLPILLSDELPKGGATPYLECLYAYMSRILELNTGKYTSQLYQRVSEQSDSKALAEIESARSQLETAKSELELRVKALESRENEVFARETRCQQGLDELRQQQEQHNERVAQFDTQWAQKERQLQSFEELNARAEQLQLREEQMTDAVLRAGQRERSLKQREAEILAREVNNPQQPVQQQFFPQQQVPITSGGTGYSRFDPRALQSPQQQAQVNGYSSQGQNMAPNMASNMAPNMAPNIAQNIIPNMTPNLAPNMAAPGFYGVSAASSQVVSARRQGLSRPGSRSQLSSPQFVQSQFTGQVIPPNSYPQNYAQGAYQQNRSRRLSRRMSLTDGIEQPFPGRRRQQSMPNNVYGQSPSISNQFSQNFHLDGVISASNDPYHFVSRAKNKPKDVKLSSGEEAYQQNRKFLHGGSRPLSSATQSYANSVNYDSAGFSSNALRSFHPGDLSISSAASGRMSLASPVGQMSNHMSSQLANSMAMNSSIGGLSNSASRVALPHPAGADFAEFNFADAMNAQTNDSSGSTESHNPSSIENGGTPNRSRSGTPPTPQGTIDQTVLNPNQKWARDPHTVPLNLS